MNWVKPPIAEEAVRTLATTYKLDRLTASILVRREFVSPGQIAFFLEEDERYLYNPFIFPDMEKAVERVKAAAEANEKVLVCGDKDADGITATVLMVETLRMMGIEAGWRVPVGEEDYGLNPQVLTEKAVEGFTLVIAVDCGISDFSEISRCGQLGMDVLVFDHHMPREGELPDAHALINPKIPDSYPFTGLCAAAIVSKFQWALSLARTEMWKESYCLMLAREEGEEIILEANLMRNLNEVSRVSASADGEGKDQLLRFVSGHPLYVYGDGTQVPLIMSFLGDADVHVTDIAPELTTFFPSIQGLSLEELESGSRMGRYFPGDGGKLSTLRNLVLAFQYRRVSAAFTSWRRGLDLVVLGTLADMMPLKDENRIMVRLGMSRLNNTDALKERRSALRELLIRQRLHEGRINTVEIAWRLCPLINAAGRMGRADAGVELFLETDPSRISVLADLLVSLNKKRRTLSEDFWDRIRPAAYESMASLRGRMVIVADNEVPRGITGILASRLQKTMRVAAVVISLRNANASGSIRCDSGMNALSWLESMGEIFEDFGGHPQAGGFRMPSARIENLKSRTLAWLDASAHNPVESEDIRIDAELSHDEIRRLGVKGLDQLLERLEPYGEGFRPLMFLTRKVKVHQAELIGKPKNNHLKLLVSLGANRWPALWWDGADKYGTVIRKGGAVDLVYHVDRDRWRGAETRRLTIQEASPCDM